MNIKISNRVARRLWIHLKALSQTPTGELDVHAIIRSLGYVQLDSIRAVSRAHHHIIWSRNQNYRETMLNELLRSDRTVFEHFTHDASVLPVEFYPMWQRQFRRKDAELQRSGWYKSMSRKSTRETMKKRIARDGPLSTEAFQSKISGKREMWKRPPHKLALDYLWFKGELSTSHRENFRKFYDLTERVIPEQFRTVNWPDEKQIDWLCEQALLRLGFASTGEIQRFWDACATAEVKQWISTHPRKLLEVEVQAADGSWFKAFAPPSIEQILDELPKPTSRLRVLNPFDPLVRDRSRLARLFGFEFRIEIFVPASKRVWGYYVFPLLEGDRLVGRLAAKADRKAGTLSVTQLWAEPDSDWGSARMHRLHSELTRLSRFIDVTYLPNSKLNAQR